MSRDPIDASDREPAGRMSISWDSAGNRALRIDSLTSNPELSLLTTNALGLGGVLAAVDDLDTFVVNQLAAVLDNHGEDDFAATFPGHDYCRWSELCSLFRSISNGLHMCVVALRDAATLLVDGPDAGDVIRADFIGEAAAQYLLGIGHQLANAALRVAVDEPEARIALRESSRKWARLVEDVVPSSSEKRAWIFHSEAAALYEILASTSGLARDASEAASELHRADAWRSMEGERGQVHHRWRPPAVAAGEDWIGRTTERLEWTLDALQDTGALLHDFLTKVPAKSPGPDVGPRLFGNPVKEGFLDGPTSDPVFADRRIEPQVIFRRRIERPEA